MVLHACPQCGGAVSDDAFECPHCGAPTLESRTAINAARARLNRNKKFITAGTIVMALILIPAIIYVIIFGFLKGK